MASLTILFLEEIYCVKFTLLKHRDWVVGVLYVTQKIFRSYILSSQKEAKKCKRYRLRSMKRKQNVKGTMGLVWVCCLQEPLPSLFLHSINLSRLSVLVSSQSPFWPPSFFRDVIFTPDFGAWQLPESLEMASVPSSLFGRVGPGYLQTASRSTHLPIIS